MIEAILDECLADIQARRATIDDCLRKYPQYAEELKPLLEFAVAIAQVPDVKPSAEFKRATRKRLFDAPSNGKPPERSDKTSPGQGTSEPDDDDGPLSPTTSSPVSSARTA